MQSKILFGFLLTACIVSCYNSLPVSGHCDGTPESWTCEGIADLGALSVVPSTVQRITILNSQLYSLPGSAFARFAGTLVYLKISNSQVSDISPGAFAGLTGLQELVLDQNQIQSIGTSWISGLNNLRILRVWKNHIVGIEPEVFNHLPNLKILDIAYNKIDYCLSPEHLVKLVKLDIIFLTENPWPLKCRPPVFFHFDQHHIQVISNWGHSHILIAECLAHNSDTYNDEVALKECVAGHVAGTPVHTSPRTPTLTTPIPCGNPTYHVPDPIPARIPLKQ